MARTAKRYLEAENKTELNMPVYRAAIYARLSVDIDKRKAESIDTQITLIKEFIQKHNENVDRECEIIVYRIYSDLGKTGTNFDRDGFERMMNDVRGGKINCILVKDFSRFGRNYIEIGNYLENILPFMNVRFISVCDNYDSFSQNAENQELSMNIKNLINDAYAKDIATKERAAKRIAQKNGEYVASIAPYGYSCKKVNGVYRLIKEPEAAKIVKRIFEEYAAGKEIQQIIDGLFEDGVHRSSDYNKYRHVYCQEGEELHQWGNSSIRALLNRNNYYGDLVQRKYESRFLRGEKGCDVLDESQWIVVPDTHEAIISRELFDKAQVRLNMAKREINVVGWDVNERAFYNVLYCGDCGRKMTTRRIRGAVFYYCSATRYIDNRECVKKQISEMELQRIVYSELTYKFQLSKIRKKDMTALSMDTFSAKIKEIQDEIKALDEEQERWPEKLAQAFMKYKEGKLSEDIYIKMKEERSNWNIFCDERKKRLEQEIKKIQKRQKEETKLLRNLIDLKKRDIINAELAEALIERIYLYGDGSLKISFRFKERDEDE